MKKISLQKITLVLILSIAFTAQARSYDSVSELIPVLPGWSFNAPDKNSHFFYFSEDSFVGTLSKSKNAKNKSNSLIVFKEQTPTPFKTPKQVQDFIEKKVIGSKSAKLVYNTPLKWKDGQAHIFSYKTMEDGELRIVHFYTYVMGSTLVHLSHSSWAMDYKNDLQATFPLMNKIKFIN